MKTKIHKITSITLSLFLVLAVFLTATHAKDLISGQSTKSKARAVEAQTARAIDEPVQKAIGELHNHSEKTMLKNFMKQAATDNAVLAIKRNEKDDHIVDDQPFSVRIMEAYFMVQLAYAYTRA